MTRFVHLSDIHFHRESNVGFDADNDIRHELVRDVRDQVRQSGPADAVLVSGDIAYSGKREEYVIAERWLDEVCDAAGCGHASVYVCPGNHDVDRAVLLTNGTILDLHDGIRSQDNRAKLDAKLNRRLQEPVAGRLFFEALKEFNEFAAGYECSFYPESFAWDKDFPLNDGSVLRLRGMNSALLSGPDDNVRTLCLGSRAWTLPRHDGVEYMVMSHHPPEWLLDGTDAQVSFDAKSRIQLFGHEHDQRIMPGRDFVRLFAGSVTPHRGEPSWRPGYNIIDVIVENSGQVRKLIVEVRLREWARQPVRFQTLENARGEAVDRTSIDLSPWTPPATWSTPPQPSEETVMTSSEANTPLHGSKPLREVINAFFRLTISQKDELTSQLSLIDESDNGLPDFERYKRALARARSEGKWKQLEELMTAMEHTE